MCTFKLLHILPYRRAFQHFSPSNKLRLIIVVQMSLTEGVWVQPTQLKLLTSIPPSLFLFAAQVITLWGPSLPGSFLFHIFRVNEYTVQTTPYTVCLQHPWKCIGSMTCTDVNTSSDIQNIQASRLQDVIYQGSRLHMCGPQSPPQ